MDALTAELRMPIAPPTCPADDEVDEPVTLPVTPVAMVDTPEFAAAALLSAFVASVRSCVAQALRLTQPPVALVIQSHTFAPTASIAAVVAA